MADHIKIGQKVEVIGKSLHGEVAYVGLTNFSPGKWIGVVLDEKDKGKNNGSVRGTTYFKCATNCGLFVRPTQLIVLSNSETVAPTVSENEMQSKSTYKSTPTTTTTTTLLCSNQKSIEKNLGQSQKYDCITTSIPTKVVSASSNNLTTHSNGNFLKATKINKPLQLDLLFSGAGATISASAPKRSKTMVSPSFCCSRQRSAFVETGFQEIHQTHFTLEYPRRLPSVSNINDSSAINSTEQLYQQQKRKCEDLETQNAKLSEELEDLKNQRIEDKKLFHEMERVRLQNEQLCEFKNQIMEQHSMVQRELQRCRQELREAHDYKMKYKRELDEMAENIELLTLDKEMAEERTETLQIELETANERIEELSLDVDIMRAEIDNNSSMNDQQNNGGKKEIMQLTEVEIRRLEQYNQRLHETVVRLRDVLTNEKQDLQKAHKELETKASEIFELKKIKEILSKRIDIMETHIIDLKEQVDAALGAESMVSSLGETKIELEERVKLLEEEVVELEALEEIHEQIIESNQELELDLREEIDTLNSTVQALQQEKNNLLETIYDRDMTIMKFRELVKTLSSNVLSKGPFTQALGAVSTACPGTPISDSLTTVSNQDETHIIDFNQMFSLTKACERAVETRMNAIELKLCKLHIEHLLAFVPEEILMRGSEHDIILVLLLLQRVYDKIDIICHAINEKFPSSCEFNKNAIFEGFSVHRYAFRCKCLYIMRSLKLIIKQLVFGLNHCDYEICTQAAIYREEMEKQEKSIDELIVRLKSDMLDENTPMEAVEGTLLFFNTLYTNLICSKNITELIDEHQLYVMLVDVLDVCLDCINTNAGVLHTIIQLGDENTESFWIMQFLMENVNKFKQKLRKLQRKLRSTEIDISTMQQHLIGRIQHILSTNEKFGRYINILSATVKDSAKSLSPSSRSKKDFPCDTGIEHNMLWRILIFNCSKFATEDKETPVTVFKQCIEFLDEEINALYHFLSEKESVRSANKNTVFVRCSATTLLQRSMQFKQQYDDIKLLKHALIERDKEVKAQKYFAKMKQNEFSEMQVRKEIAERNLSKTQQNQKDCLIQLIEQIEFLEKLMQQNENVFVQLFNNLQEKLLTLERNYAFLERNLFSSKQVINLTTDEHFRDIVMFQNCLRYERAERMKLHINKMKFHLNSFEPIFVPNDKVTNTEVQLTKELRMLKNQWIISHIKLKPGIEIERCNLKRKSDEILQGVMSTYFKSHSYRRSFSAFGSFGSKEINQIFK